MPDIIFLVTGLAVFGVLAGYVVALRKL